MGSGVMIYMQSLMKTGSGIQKLLGDMIIHRQQGDLTDYRYIFKTMLLALY
jgi:hypothetical protein